MSSGPTRGKWTLDNLAGAMRGMRRDARIMVRLPDGRLAGLDHVAPGYYGTDGAQVANGGRYVVVLVCAGQ